MEGKYEILFDNRQVGTAEVSREGLYYRFSCKCKFPEESLYQIRFYCDDQEYSLGTCIPVSGGFGINTRIPVKAIQKGRPSFYAALKNENTTGKFIPINRDAPISCIEQLAQAHYEIRNGVPGICIP